jgi:hypothetical protein
LLEEIWTPHVLYRYEIKLQPLFKKNITELHFCIRIPVTFPTFG